MATAAEAQARRILLGLGEEVEKESKEKDDDSSDDDEPKSDAAKARQRAKEARLINRGVAMAERAPKFLGCLSAQDAEASWRNAVRRGAGAVGRDAAWRRDRNAKTARDASLAPRGKMPLAPGGERRREPPAGTRTRGAPSRPRGGTGRWRTRWRRAAPPSPR